MSQMTLQERGILGATTVSRLAKERGDRLRALLDQGEPLKRAAWKAGMACRTARRHRQRWQG